MITVHFEVVILVSNLISNFSIFLRLYSYHSMKTFLESTFLLKTRHLELFFNSSTVFATLFE